MFKRVLIANRGEIAVRIIRTLREMGIESVVVYSDADATSLHVLRADYAYHLGPSMPEASYLDMERIVAIAKESHSDAIHPGYGFLSENPEFARLCEREGIVFIGPTPGSMQLMGNKVEARNVAKKVGVPVIPGTEHGLTDAEIAYKEAKEIGFPVLLKAQMGGGGKGMRIVRKESEFKSLFNLATNEAKNAFGDGRIYVEKFIENPRHVEIQILADTHGNVIALGERDCSVQRRHQKVIEESPSPFLTEKTRKEMMEAAVALIRESGYTNAGTVEFLVTPEQNFYFLEVNARLQVEHPVTEMRFNIDIVREQILIAMGHRLSLSEKVEPSGHAIEARIYAEDPYNDFYPSPGRINFLLEPGGAGIRVDSGVYQGFTVPVEYDPILSKVIAWGTTREESLLRLKRAIKEYVILGIQTNLPLHQYLLENERFVSGDYDTNILSDLVLSKPKADLPILASIFKNNRSRFKVSEKKPRGSDWKRVTLPKYIEDEPW